MNARRLLALAVIVCCGGAAAPTPPAELDSQLVLNRYAAALASCTPVKTVAFTYSVSQAGAHNIEQTHRIFRSGTRQRDETIAVEGDPVKMKMVRIASKSDRYAIANVAPRLSAYGFLFLGTHHDGRHLDYAYAAEPLGQPAFHVTELTVDGATYLPALIRFTMTARSLRAKGALSYQKIGTHCVPLEATVSAVLNGKPTRERILWSAYSFPASLPPSTFYQPKPLAVPTLPPL